MGKTVIFVGIGAAAAAACAVAWLVLSGGASAPTTEGAESTAAEESGAVASLRGSAKKKPTAAPHTGSYHVKGRVVDRTGAPVAGVPVAARRTGPADSDPASLASKHESEEARYRNSTKKIDEGKPEPWVFGPPVDSGKDGRFELVLDRTGAYEVAGRPAPPRTATSRTVQIDDTTHLDEIEVLVLEGSPLEGRLVDGAGHGVVGLVEGNWEVDGVDEGWSFEPLRSSAGTGSFELAAVPAGKGRLDVTVPGRAMLEDVQVKTPHDGVLTIRVDGGGGAVSGRVRNSAGEPVASADVTIWTRAPAAADRPEGTPRRAVSRGKSGADGAYRIADAWPGKVERVEALAPGYVLHSSRAPIAPWNGAEVGPGAETKIDVVLERGGSVVGRVVTGPTHAPVPGAQVRLHHRDPGNTWQMRSVGAVTAEDGSFRIEGVALGKWVILAEAPGMFDAAAEAAKQATTRPWESRGAPAELVLVVTREGETVERTIELAAGVPVKGRVLGPDGQPVEGAGVTAIDYGLGSHAWYWGIEWGEADARVATTEADGTFVVLGLSPRPEWRLQASKPPLASRRSAPFSVAAGETTPEILIRLERGASVAGHVLDTAGKPARGVTIQCSPKKATDVGGDARAESGADGSYVVEGLPPTLVSIEAWGGDWGESSAKDVTPALVAGERREGVDVTLTPQGHVKGTIVDEKGDGVGPFEMEVHVATGDKTDDWGEWCEDDGSFNVYSSIGARVSIKVKIEGETPVETVVTAPAEGVKIVVKPKPLTILEGRVTDPGGTPVPLCRLEITSAGGESAFVADWGYDRGEIVNGTFRKRVNGSPPFEVKATSARDANGRPMNLTSGSTSVADPKSGPVTVVMSAGLAIAGRVLGEDERGVEGASVSAARADAAKDQGDGPARLPAGGTKTDASGAFAVVGLEVGSYAVRVDPPKGFVVPDPVNAAAGSRDVLVRLSKGFAIAGRVVGPDGLPRPHVSVNANWASEGRAGSGSIDATTRADGAFRFDGMPPSAVAVVSASVREQDEDDVLLPTTVPDVRAGTQDLVLRLRPGASIRGTLTAPGGTPPPNLTIKAFRVGTEGKATAGNDVAEDGSFSISPLEPGEWIVVVEDGTAGEVARSATVAAPASGVKIAVPDPFDIVGRVVGAGNLEEFGIRVWVDGKPPTTDTMANTDAEGAFTVRLPRGAAYRLAASKDDDDRYAVSGPLKAGGTSVVLTLVGGAAISGIVEYPAAATPKDRERTLVKATNDGWAVQVQPDGEGKFLLRGLPPGSYSLVAVENGRTGEAKVDGVPAGTANVRLRLP